MISKEEIQQLLVKNKNRLAKEIAQSKELVLLLKKSTTTKLTIEEQEKVKIQLIDVFKTIPAFAIFMLPGGLILLPLVAKLLPEILPSAFRSEEEE